MTAEEMYRTQTGCIINHHDVKIAMIKFAEYHVRRALEEAAEKAELDSIGYFEGIKENIQGYDVQYPEDDYPSDTIYINKNSILNSYSVYNIK